MRRLVTATEKARELALVAAAAAADKLATDVIVLDVSDQLVITDCFVIASAPNERQVGAIVDNVEERCGRQAPSRSAAREPGKDAGSCSTSSTSSCTSSTPRSARSTRSSGSGRTAHGSS